METLELQKKTEYNAAHIYKTIKEDPQYFGGYLNMARHNIYSISNHASSKFNLKPLSDEEKIIDSFLCNEKKKHLNWNHVFSIALKFLPIIKVFDFESLPKNEQANNNNTGKDFAQMAQTLKKLFSEIQQLRNDYSHYYSINNNDIRKISVSNEVAIFLQDNIKRAIEYTKSRFSGVLSDEDFENASNRKLIEQNNILTTDGFVFLISMFLEREHAFQFIGKIKGLKGTQSKSFIATREVFMAFCLKLPHDRFVSEDKTQALTLDIINTLNRCPKELYSIITEKEKQQFKPTLDNLKLNNLLENSLNDTEVIEDYDTYIESLTRKIRHSNRFSYFALKYIDETNIFQNIRFQINLGKLLIDKYEKPINNEMYPRTIIENVKAFGKLSDFEDETEALHQIDKNGNSLGFEQFAPHYNTSNNKIALYTNNAKAIIINNPKAKSKIKNNLKQPLPEAFLSLHELPKIILLEYLQKGKSEEIINDFILANNTKITNRKFIEEVKRMLPNDWDIFKKKTDPKNSQAYKPSELTKLKTRKKILNTVLEPHNLNDKQIPTRILDYWLNIVDVNIDRAIADKIKLMKRDGTDRLKAFNKFKKEGKGKIPKIGEMATFLAKDIVNMIISEDKKKKITSFYYDKMQECLALFADPEKKALFIEIITKDLQLNKFDGHPFLKEIQLRDIHYTQDFYSIYLQHKVCKLVSVKNYKKGRTDSIDKSWMTKNFYCKEWDNKLSKQKTVVKLPADLSNIPFSLRQLIEKESSSLYEWLDNIINGKNSNDGKRPISLPTNLFDEELINLLQMKLNEKNASYPSDAKYNELFKIWWTTRNDDTQSFYNAEREYVIYDQKINFKLQKGAKFAYFYADSLKQAFKNQQDKRAIKKRIDRKLPDIELTQVEKVFKRTISNTEKHIRLTQEQDQIMALMLEKLMSVDKNLNIKLSEISTLLNDTITVRKTVSGKLSFSNENTISKIILDQRKRKDHSMLNKYIHDRRLPELFEYFADTEIPINNLKVELESYNTAKHIVLDSAFKLEATLIKKNYTDQLLSLIDKKFNGQSIQHKPYLMFLRSKGVINENEFLFLNMVRNCFSHNQFPQRNTMNLLIKDWNKNNFALQIATIYNQKTETIMAEL